MNEGNGVFPSKILSNPHKSSSSGDLTDINIQNKY